MPNYTKKVFNEDEKFDIQLDDARQDEDRFFEIMAKKRVELKTEQFQWEKTGNIAIEYRCRGKPSGLSVTEADFWVHELTRDGETLGYFMFPVENLKKLARARHRAGWRVRGVGDRKEADIILLKIYDLLRHREGPTK